jgi:type I restriction enzyme S subunit
MKNGWEIKKLGEVCEIELGKTPYRGDKSFWDTEKLSNNIWLSIADLLNSEGDIILDGKEYITNKAVKQCKIVKQGTLLVSFKLTLGRMAFAGVDLYTNEAIAALTIRKDINLDKYYLFHFLQSFDWDSAAEGDVKVKGKTLNKAKLKNILISYPKSLSEQQRIVSILDKAFAALDKAKANAEQNLKNARELFESCLQEVFENKGEDWEEKTLGDVCVISSKLIDPKEAQYQNYIHIGAGNIEPQKGVLNELKTAKEENLISGKFLFDESMVLYSKIRPYLMKVVKCDFRGLCSADIYPLLPLDNMITRDFLFYLLLTRDFTEYAIKGSQRAGMPKVNREHLFAYYFYLPPLKDQQLIVQKLDAISAQTQQLESIYRRKIADLEEMRKSVLQKAFSGEL